MDANKLERLIDIEYVVRRVCGNCTHSIGLLSEWGLCSQHDYEHLKHADSQRLLSVHYAGSCPQHMFKASLSLGAFDEFKEE